MRDNDLEKDARKMSTLLSLMQETIEEAGQRLSQSGPVEYYSCSTREIIGEDGCIP